MARFVDGGPQYPIRDYPVVKKDFSLAADQNTDHLTVRYGTSDWLVVAASGHFKNDDNTGTQLFVLNTGGYQNQYCKCTFAFTEDIATEDLGPMLRYVDTDSYYQARFHDGQLKITHRDGAAYNVITQVAFNAVWNQLYTMQFYAIGNELTVYVDDTLLLSATDSSLTVGGIGFRAYQNKCRMTYFQGKEVQT